MFKDSTEKGLNIFNNLRNSCMMQSPKLLNYYYYDLGKFRNKDNFAQKLMVIFFKKILVAQQFWNIDLLRYF